MNENFVLNESQQVNDDLNIIQAHPVLIVIFGTTEAEVPVVLDAQLEGTQGLVPRRALVVDSLAYEEVVTRLVQNGYTEKQVQQSLPRSHYFHLTSPFSDDFDFDHPLNRAWLTTIFEPALRRLAAKPNAPGCAGTPALGRARIEGNEQDLRQFFERHLQELTQVRTQTLALLPGVKVFVATTYRGGSGTGATTTGSAVLRSVINNGSTIHLHAIMPCVYTSDDRAYANAYAMFRENQHYHRFEGDVPMKGDRLLKPPFDSTTYTFASNGTVTLSHRDAVMLEVAILRAHLRAPTQAAINARQVDLTDVIPHDLEDKPMHVRIETAISIRTVQPGTQEYLVTEWIRQELSAAQSRFEAWWGTGKLTTEEQSRLNATVENIIKVRALALNALLGRLDPSPTPTNALRSFFETANGRIGSMDGNGIKQSMVGLPQQVREAFLKFERAWEDGALKLAETLPREVADDVRSQLADSPPLALAALSKLADHFASLAQAAAKEAENEKKKRDAASAQLGSALNAVQEAGSFIPFIKKNEVTRDAAHKACEIAQLAALARAQQQRLETLQKVLEGGMTALNSRGMSVPIPSVTTALTEREVEQSVEIRKHYAEKLDVLQGRLDDLSQQIEKRSPVFQRALLYDGMTRKKLNEMVTSMHKGQPAVPPIVKFLEGKQSLAQTLEELLPLLPTYAESGRSLTQMVTEDPVKCRLVVQLSRNLLPFTPLNREVEEQQGLRNRRDSLLIFELPGGQDGMLADLLRREGLVTNLNQVVESGDDEIRGYFLRDGLPYAAIHPLERYKERHDSYIKSLAAITPYTVSGADQFPGLEALRINLRLYTEELLCAAKAVLPHRVAKKPSGGFILRYEKDTGHGFTTPAEENFSDFDSMSGWLAKRVETRKALEAELNQHLDDDPAAYKAALFTGWQQATGSEREHLQQALFRLKVDPNIIVNSKRKPSKSKQKASKPSKRRTS